MVNIKSFNFAISSLLVMSLAACSSDDSTENGGGLEMNNQASSIGVILNSTDNRVMNYPALTSGAKLFTRALPTSAPSNLGLSFPKVPSYTKGYFGEEKLEGDVTYQSGAATFPTGTLNLNGHNLVLNHNLTLSGLQGSGNIYVQGTRTLTLKGVTELPAGVKIYVNGGGKLVVTANSFTVAKDAGLYAKNAFYKSGDGEKKTVGTDGTFVGKDFTNNGEVLTEYELRAQNITLGKDSKTQIGTNLYATGDLEADGELAASFLSAQASTVKGTVTVENTFNSEKSLTVDGGTLYGNFIKAGDYTNTKDDADKFILQENGSKIIVGDKGVVETYTYYNTDAKSSLELANGNLGMLLTKNLVLAGENNTFIKTCAGGKMGVYFKHAYNNTTSGTQYNWDDVAFSGASVLKVNHDDDFAYISLPEVKDGEGKVIFSGFNTEGKGINEAHNFMNLRQTAAVAYGTNDYVRTNRSATSVALNGNNVYVSYHTQGTGQAGMLDYLTVDANGNATLVQSLSAVNATVGTKSGSNAIDWNNLLLDGDKLIGVGNSENGGVITALKLSGNKFDVAEGTSSIGSDKSPLTYCRLQTTTAEGQAGDGNAVIKVGDAYVAATTYGIETFNSNLEETYATPLTKGKYVAKDGDNVYVSYLNNGTMGINSYAASDTRFATPTSVATINNVTPENGKNVMVVDGNYIYVATGEGGLDVYNGSTLVKTFKPSDATYTADDDDTHGHSKGDVVTRGYCNGVAVDGSHVFLAYGSLGVIVLNKSDLTSASTTTVPEVARYCAGNGSANFVAVSGNLVYVAYGKNNLQVLKLEPAYNR